MGSETRKKDENNDEDEEPSPLLSSFKGTLSSYQFTKNVKIESGTERVPKKEQAVTPPWTPAGETSTSASPDGTGTLPTSRGVKREATEMDDDYVDEPKSSLATSSLSIRGTSNTLMVVKDESSTTVQSRKKGKSMPNGYAPPEMYAHLNYLLDVIEPNLICLFVGTNPGVRTAEEGHAYSHPTNHFWRDLHNCGCTTRRLQPCEDQDLPRLFSLGNTNIVARPTKNQSELSFQEMVEGTATLETKIRLYQPEAVCIVGVGIWHAIWKAKQGKKIRPREMVYGWQDESHNLGRFRNETDAAETLGNNRTTWDGAKVFVTCSTSGLVGLPPDVRASRWKALGDWVVRRRAERGNA
ncbi:MAG: pyruvate dehydrogenase E1, beta subunit [Watsoniomyces obsoletus]|nr:MAG: pyruvate dehydrogenase E1, beta subunit [Watsoniomyces obsoletus]